MALGRAPWQGSGMSNDNPSSKPSPAGPRGGGCLIAMGLVLGPVAGWMLGQVSAGLLVGGALGVVAAVILAVVDRRR